MKCECCELNKNITTLIFETRHWHVILNRDQALLGKTVVASRRHCENLSSLTVDEWTDLKSVIIKLESALKKAFSCEPINWSCLMNGAYENRTAPHIHWHVDPRYCKEVKYAGLKFIDPNYGNPHDYKRINVLPKETLDLIIGEIRKNLK